MRGIFNHELGIKVRLRPDPYLLAWSLRFLRQCTTARMRANTDLPANAIAVTCDRRYLREVRICMTRDLHFRACPEVDRRACRSREVVMAPVRGG